MARTSLWSGCVFLLAIGNLHAQTKDPLPFEPKVETYKDRDGETQVFKIRLEQPFLAEEFEKGNFLRLRAKDNSAYLIYPRETKFKQKQAEFYGRLRGRGTAKLKLTYEIVTENVDGSKKVAVREGEIAVPIPAEPTGSEQLFREWAEQQNVHFLQMLRYYPDDSFLQYCLLQSGKRYGISTPDIPKPRPTRDELEYDIYRLFTGSYGLQECMQREALSGVSRSRDLKIHISQLTPPQLPSLDYDELLKTRIEKDKVAPKPHSITKLVPADQYFLHFHSVAKAAGLWDQMQDWGDNLLRLVRVRSLDYASLKKLEDQLCVRRAGLVKLSDDGAIGEIAFTGSDLYLVEGSDVTLIVRTTKPDAVATAAAGWLADVKTGHKDIAEQQFHYRGQKIEARYTDDRAVSSFLVKLDDCMVFSNSHRAIRKTVDAFFAKLPNLHDAKEYQYVTTLLPPPQEKDTGYFFASEAFLKRQFSPEVKLGQRRRLEAYNHMVMLNNASMLFRMENGRSPTSLNELIQNKFVDPEAIAHSAGATYAYSAKHDAFTSSLYNRLKYLTPIAELNILEVSSDEQQEYERYRRRYENEWKYIFSPMAVRMEVGSRIKYETCVLPMPGGVYGKLRVEFGEQPQTMATGAIASTAIKSFEFAAGKNAVADLLRTLPGVKEALQADPTLTDMNWLGEKCSIQFCDAAPILEIDPTLLRPLNLYGIRSEVSQQSAIAAGLLAMELPIYSTIDVIDREKAGRFLKQLSSEVFLHPTAVGPFKTEPDAYQLPAYRNHAIYVLAYRLYAAKIRLHIALVGDRLVAATTPDTLRQVIDATINAKSEQGRLAHAVFRLNFRAVNRLRDSLELYWAEKARLASHRNIMPIYNLLKIYDVKMEDVPRLSQSKYGVAYVCPEGRYYYDANTDEVVSTAFGNRQQSRQNLRLNRGSSFARFWDSLDEIVATIRFEKQAMFATFEVARSAPKAETKAEPEPQGKDSTEKHGVGN